MEAAKVGVRTRARAMAEEADDNLGAVKRRKIGNENLRSPSSRFVQNKTLDCEYYANLAPVEGLSGSGTSLGSCCSSTSRGSMEKLKAADLEESVETETNARYELDGNESAPTTEFNAESGEVDSNAVKQSSVLPTEKMPPATEVDEFFAAAQKDLHTRFKHKYNYDIVNDIPLKGRFEWIQLKPQK